jgi:dihydrofolate reductase
MKVKFIAIAALGKNREIGLKGKLPWNIPEEYAQYKKTVKNHFVLVGRKNFEANGSDIEGSRAIVLSRNEYSHPKAEIVCHSMTKVVEFAEKNSIHTIYVIGGSEIYQLTLPYLSEFMCSVVDYEGPADTFFPEYRFYEWEVIHQEVHNKWSLYHLKKTPDF